MKVTGKIVMIYDKFTDNRKGKVSECQSFLLNVFSNEITQMYITGVGEAQKAVEDLKPGQELTISIKVKSYLDPKGWITKIYLQNIIEIYKEKQKRLKLKL